MFTTIIKRDGRTAAYDVEKIANAIFPRQQLRSEERTIRPLIILLCRWASVWRKNMLRHSL